MVEIKGFRGLRYSVSNLSDVITQPYDKITEEMQEEYYKRQYNYVRLILNRESHASAAKMLREWMDKGVLKKDEADSIYPLEQEFQYKGKTFVRRGFFAIFKLDENDVVKHEKTLSKPKEDRLKLLREMECDLEPIFLLYDRDVKVSYEEKIAEGTEAEVKNRLYRISGEEVERIRDALLHEKVLIADGHHRYEVALEYLKEKGAEYKMAVFVSMRDPALIILPTHRLLYDVTLGKEEESRMRKLFDVEEIKTMREPEKHEFIMHDGSRIFSLRPKSYNFDEREHTKDYWVLDTAMFQRLVIEEVFGIQDIEAHVKYVREVNEEMIGKNDLLFLLHPTSIEEVKRVSAHGEVMPQKSTDFYPKLPSGMVAYDLRSLA
ncbi:MAG: DUF1015 domain-containing protein [Candidatus Thermoplasmatota archaeon]|nr:DUF1015 domain-containing protein [Candidatus Thermoplasmatota archaeon]